MHERFIKHLEKAGRLNRALEFLPDDEEFAERRAAKLGLTSPERAVLLAYAKIALNEALVDSDVPDDPFISTALERYFPARLREPFRAEIYAHPLRREIIATHVTNSMVNRVGSTFVYRMQDETGAAAPDVVRAYLIVREVFGFVDLWRAIEALDYKVPDRRADRHDHRRRPADRARDALVPAQRPRASRRPRARDRAFRRRGEARRGAPPRAAAAGGKSAYEAAARRLEKEGVPAELARAPRASTRCSARSTSSRSPAQLGRDIDTVARVYFGLAGELDFPWLRSARRHARRRRPLAGEGQGRAAR